MLYHSSFFLQKPLYSQNSSSYSKSVNADVVTGSFFNAVLSWGSSLARCYTTFPTAGFDSDDSFVVLSDVYGLIFESIWAREQYRWLLWALVDLSLTPVVFALPFSERFWITVD
ncbi:hypothetical protein O9993_12630 [Vibrio lentus]|nr:hypothetical protein [Vibrio lentus]